ncbi:hypothetical protein MPDQ_005265 [Monascus purpureus]|uniref:NmrA-like domain-containing protein n=1 Tax=Monascus purpureus TaxID=5098 RepID=A0A507QGC1_MONPU|nr:hypothetical protein MPDQ_005265 [Monascus purpureus]BDD57727.1 hypothetical protein MAP00_003071 [Monascus purpureus]
MSSPTVFVCGATGAQGGAVSHHLAKGAKVHTVTRNDTSEASHKLRAAGASIIPGNFDDEQSLRQRIQGCTALFLNLVPDFQDESHELNQARRIIAIAKESGVQHIVYSSAFAMNEPHRLRHWDTNNLLGKTLMSKQAIKNEVCSAGFPFYTILCPGSFMSNFLLPLVRMYPGLVDKGQFTTALTPETEVAMVDPNDIGRFCAEAVLDSVRFHKAKIPLASELLTVEDILGALSRATGRRITAHFLSSEEIEEQSVMNPVILGEFAMRDIAQFADIEGMRAWGFPLGSFESFLEREMERVKQTYGF